MSSTLRALLPKADLIFAGSPPCTKCIASRALTRLFILNFFFLADKISLVED
jgi:hypothetical protein